ncbi:FAD-dependent 5-carboxymethylaminomethyl-2-thiouridine(34) oxidoreductase MnmC [Phenylobacterium montanum]|uniref:tRNA 5-methylaminomethyl-2-thiouridine biosynthesis bifunctional protein MnmC n=1 Tax=Phenylobacterium montanum TaxID=2823693 RepID=A0A975ITI7_9CAUL|nr:FAD-dependent 5-carboxymethylaminomethyl-2-thiouridine(34) oxidoreductase MnmC [Caulobacter sp. S6]QUD86775.1 FAD-dependent 5-carboxymethylaminomethyl-2-thiouridine(34) oxidoreductase MnmC [Caulobacter sp. S6]
MRPDDDSPVLWDENGLPRSRLFDDVYFSAHDGLAETRAVFLAGCALPEAWAGRRRFTAGELGFGSGLNILALLDLWARTREPGAQLSIFSVEAFPMPAEDAARVLAHWPELASLAERLVARWPRRARGFHRIAFDEIGARLDLAVMDAAEALAAWDGRADAWFLDGFSPAANPGMWSPEVLAGVAAHSAPGARAATFTVAGAVRRGLAEQGFAVEKRQGFGRKRERLEAVLPGAPTPESASPRVAIVGAGIAGAALARAFAAQGAQVTVIEAERPGAGGSGNSAALVMPRLDAGGAAVAQLYAQAFARACDVYDETLGAVIARGALQLETGPKDPSRFDRIAASDLFEAGRLARLAVAETAGALGEDAEVGGLFLADGRVVAPAAVLDAWLAGAKQVRAEVAGLERGGDGWRLIGPDGELIASADRVCLANGLAAQAFAPNLPLSPVRGQISLVRTAEPPPAVMGAGYLIPTRDGLVFGATHDRDDTDTAVRPDDHARNLALLAQVRPSLAAELTDRPWEGRASLRAACPDFLPLAGAVSGQAGLFVLSGLGSRGFCAAPLLAEHVAAQALGAPSPLPAPLAAIVDPARFAKRSARRRSEPVGEA